MSNRIVPAENLTEYFPVENEEGAPENPWLSLVGDAADIVTKEIPAPVEIIEGLVTDHAKFVIGSGSKSFKTWITIALGLAIAHRGEFWGRRTERKRVLYCNLELKEQTFERRVQVIAQRLGIEAEPGWFRPLHLRGRLAGLTVFEAVNRIINTAQEIGAEVVVLDPVYKLNLEGDENSSRDQTLFFNQLDRITTEGGCTLILNDHFGKGDQSGKDPLDAIRGSSAKGGDVDAAMVLRKHEVEGCFSVDVIHRELPPVAPFVVEWQFPLMVLRDDLDASAMKKQGGRPRSFDTVAILTAIAETTVENPISVSAWALRAGMKRPTLIEYLPTLRAKGYIRTTGEGSKARQYISPKGLELLEKGEA